MKIARPKGVVFAWQRAVRDDEKLTYKQKLVAFVVGSYMDPDGTRAFPMVKTIARGAGYYEAKEIHSTLRELEAAGYLRIDRRPGRTSVYDAIFPDPGDDQGGNAPQPPADEHPDTEGEITPTPEGESPPARGGHKPPRPVPLPPPAPARARVPAPSQATPEQALAQLRDLVDKHKTLKAFELPEAVRVAADDEFRAKSNRLLQLCSRL